MLGKYKFSTENLSNIQDVAEVLLYITVRAVLGVFVSLVTSTTLYLVSLPVVLSIWARTSIDFDVVGMVFTSAGATIGGFLVWLERDRPGRVQLVFLGLTLLFAAAGAWIGLISDSGVRYDILGLPGIPVLISLIVGAALGANVPHFLIMAVKAFKNPRL